MTHDFRAYQNKRGKASLSPKNNVAHDFRAYKNKRENATLPPKNNVACSLPVACHAQYTGIKRLFYAIESIVGGVGSSVVGLQNRTYGAGLALSNAFELPSVCTKEERVGIVGERRG